MRFVPNPNVDQEIQREPEYTHMLHAQAKVVRRHAEVLGKRVGAPWMPRKGAEGVFVVVQDGIQTIVLNTDHGGHLIEWGSKNNPPHAVLRRAVNEAGLKRDVRELNRNLTAFLAVVEQNLRELL